jgi:pimeloyl-ACP methyl ester carboxylesterase
MPRVVLVHGSVTGGRATWSAQRRRLRDKLELVLVERPGFPPNRPVERVDFVEHARWLAQRLELGDHLVGHSYGGVVSLLAAAEPDVRLASLTVIEPPCTAVAAGDPDADRFAHEGRSWWETGPRDDPEAFLRGFLRYVGSAYEPPSPLPPDLEQGARTLIVERGPWEADIPLSELRTKGTPTLVVSGAHHAAFDAICDALERELAADRVVIPGSGHNPQQDPAFDAALLNHAERAESRRG